MSCVDYSDALHSFGATASDLKRISLSCPTDFDKAMAAGERESVGALQMNVCKRMRV